MSISTAAVRFPDGHIQFVAFNETGMLLLPHLFRHAEDAYCYGALMPYVDEIEEADAYKDSEPVDVFVNGAHSKYTLKQVLRANRGAKILIVQRLFIPDLPKTLRVPGVPDWWTEFINS